MRTIMKISPSLAAIALVAACGGTTTVMAPDPIALTATTRTEGPTPILYDPGLATLSLNGTSVVDPRETEAITNGNASYFLSAAPLTFSTVAQNGDIFAVSAATNGGTNSRGQVYGNRVAGELARVGSATYSGDYAGIFVRDATGALSQSFTAAVDGDVTLNVNLADGTMTGAITDRLSYNMTGTAQAPASTFADAQITNGSIAADGSFDATVTGGARTIVLGDYTVDSGTANGTFAGTTGQTAGGVVTINMTHPTGGTYTELGSFIATAD